MTMLSMLMPLTEPILSTLDAMKHEAVVGEMARCRVLIRGGKVSR